MSNPRLEKVKEKMKLAKQNGIDPQVKGFIDSIEKAAIEKVEGSIEAKMVEKVTGLVNEVKQILSSQNNDTQALLEFLDEQKTEYKNLSKYEAEKLTGIADAIMDMAKEVERVKQAVKSQKYPEFEFDYARVQKAFTKALDTVVKILVGANQEPNSVVLTYSRQGKLVSVVENHDGFVVTRELTYGRNGKVERIINTRS